MRAGARFRRILNAKLNSWAYPAVAEEPRQAFKQTNGLMSTLLQHSNLRVMWKMGEFMRSLKERRLFQNRPNMRFWTRQR